jgi:hypothetical protein
MIVDDTIDIARIDGYASRKIHGRGGLRGSTHQRCLGNHAMLGIRAGPVDGGLVYGQALSANPSLHGGTRERGTQESRDVFSSLP